MSQVDLKVVLLGKEYCGKTSLVERYLYDRFNGTAPYQNTIGAAYGAKQVLLRNKKVTLGIWDTAGSERYEAMSRIYYRGAGVAIVCFDLTDKASFQKAKKWVSELRKHEEKCRVFLCGTKKDLIDDGHQARAVNYSTALQYAEELEGCLFETSSKTGEGVAELFSQVAQTYASSTSPFTRSGSKLKLEEPHPATRNCC
ncbi:ras-related protein Rab-24-like isoform X1 [Ornithodoros turicata]|uniref:ras-related protein Rab-24-like isoform X1 n=1 Tax=Ornithodoros turicata TaxID=34597 RepID=UPI0031397E48